MPTGDKRNRYKNRWIRKVLAAGHKIVIEVLVVTTAEKWKADEIHTIKQLLAQGARLTNGTAGGEGGAMVGWAREKLIAARRAPEYRAAQSTRLKGKPKSAEAVENNRRAQQRIAKHHSDRQKGRKFSDEHKQKLRDAALRDGPNRAERMRKRMAALSPEAKRALAKQATATCDNEVRIAKLREVARRTWQRRRSEQQESPTERER